MWVDPFDIWERKVDLLSQDFVTFTIPAEQRAGVNDERYQLDATIMIYYHK